MPDEVRRIRLVTEWSTDDPELAETLRMIAAEPEWSVTRLEMEAGLHMMQARFAWRRADQIRERQNESDRRAARKPRGEGVCPVCGTTVALVSDGTLRMHDTGSRGRGSFTTPCTGSHNAPAEA